MKVIGFKNINYISKTGREVNGVELQCTYKTPKVKGEAVEKVYVSSRAFEEGETFSIGDEVKLIYNKYGKISEVLRA